MENTKLVVLLVCIIYVLQCTSVYSYDFTLYKKFYHIRHDRYLSSDGKAHAAFTGNDQLYFLYELGYGKTLMYSFPWLNTTSTELRAMDAFGGCRLGLTVKEFQITKRANQLWNIQDGIIYSACNPNWILHVDNYGAQTIKDINTVPEDERKFKITDAMRFEWGGDRGNYY